jgi:predicted nucleic acid-binding protein
MLRYLLDTNVLAEPLAREPDPLLLQRLERHQEQCATAAPVVHEIRYGIELLPPSRRREAYERYLEEVVLRLYPVLPYDQHAAARHARERARQHALGVKRDGGGASLALSLREGAAAHPGAQRGRRHPDQIRGLAKRVGGHILGPPAGVDVHRRRAHGPSMARCCPGVQRETLPRPGASCAPGRRAGCTILPLMTPRALLFAAVLVSIASPGCKTTQPQARVKLPITDPASRGPGAGSRGIALQGVPKVDRPSELAHVTEEKADPEALRQFQARMAQAAIPLVPTTSPPKITGIALDDTRRGEAPGMKPEGALFTATLAEGQRAAMPVKLPLGECVTFIAQGGLGVIELDLFLTTGQGDSARILAEDPASGPIAVIGGRGQCYSAAEHDKVTDATLHAAARRGAGVVLVQEFRK